MAVAGHPPALPGEGGEHEEKPGGQGCGTGHHAGVRSLTGRGGGARHGSAAGEPVPLQAEPAGEGVGVVS